MPAAIEASGPCGALGWRAMGKIYPMAVAIARAFKSFDQKRDRGAAAVNERLSCRASNAGGDPVAPHLRFPLGHRCAIRSTRAAVWAKRAGAPR